MPASQDNGKLIIFVIGGVGRTEVSALQSLEKESGSSNIIIGSTGVHTPKEFIKQLANPNANSDESSSRKKQGTGRSNLIEETNMQIAPTVSNQNIGVESDEESKRVDID